MSHTRRKIVNILQINEGDMSRRVFFKEPFLYDAASQLIHEPQNQLNSRAVRINFNDQKLGYIPRLNRGEAVQACVADLTISDDPWDSVPIEAIWVN